MFVQKERSGAMSELFQQTFGEENIREALLHLSKKKDSCGLDGIYLSQLPDYWEKCGEQVIRQLQERNYEPGVVKEYASKEKIEIVDFWKREERR